jgi:glutamate carboxypeptidase
VVADGAARLQHLRGRVPEMVESLAALVAAESPSSDAAGLAACAAAITELFSDRLGSAPSPGPHLLWTGGGPTRVLILGHYDTVWPLGTTTRWPFARDGDRATGPGSFDMKAGIVQIVEALATIDDPAGVTVLLTADEELGSQTSRTLIEDTARPARAALVCEPSLAGRLKSARKGTGMYTLHVHGRAAHAGLEPEKGANALVGLAEVVLAASRLGDTALGTTVVPTVAAAGTATNVVPAEARLELDVRVSDLSEADRVDAAVRALRPTAAGTTISVEGGPNRPPMEASPELVTLAEACAADLGIGPLGAVSVGGASDANFAAAVGTPTLDGLGAVGDGLHAEGEHVIVPTMPERSALLAELVVRLLQP